jgi:alpha-D-ribose 1-methylphosphonate 5-triphosphate synthase subunit PhnH
MTPDAHPTALAGGLTDAPRDGARAFRVILQALARPGTILPLAGARPPAPLSPAAGTALLVLVDSTTPLHLAGPADTPEVRAWIAFHCGAKLVAAEEADFALGTWEALQPVARFPIGLPDYPDRSATLIVEVPHLANHGPALTGPGIETVTWLNLPDRDAFRQNRAHFPLGFDTLFTCGRRVAGLPRSTRVEAA